MDLSSFHGVSFEINLINLLPNLSFITALIYYSLLLFVTFICCTSCRNKQNEKKTAIAAFFLENFYIHQDISSLSLIYWCYSGRCFSRYIPYTHELSTEYVREDCRRLCSTFKVFKGIKSTLLGLKQILVIESPLRIMKNDFYFTWKALLVLIIFNFFLSVWSCIKTVWFKKSG